jgi:sulfhydrogenase subunit beta (sulfur reductase)
MDITMKVISKNELETWLGKRISDTCVVAPVDNHGKLVYQKISSPDQIVWKFGRADLSPKTWLFPMSEAILNIEQGTQTMVYAPPAPESRILFAVRPCDARSMIALDVLFLDKKPVDSQYARHRESAVVIGLSCPQMGDTCFCTIVGGAPNSKNGMDILLTEIDSGFAVEIISDKGKALFADLPLTDKEITLEEPKVKENLPPLRKSKEWNELFNDLYWKQLSNSCISCRTCSFVCPACRCFDVRDELISIKPNSKQYERLRAWDACTASGYRRIAGGHNPRDTQEKRLRNRFFCKFVYYPEDFGPMGCVGCGRCIDACPTGINILEVIENVDKLLDKKLTKV